MSVPSIPDLVALTQSLVHEVPKLKGAFPDFSEQLMGMNARSQCRSVYVVGTIKSGKSTLINALLGQDLMPRGAGVKTFNLIRLQPSNEREARVLFKGTQQLKRTLDFDYRVLGFDQALPDDLFADEGLAQLEAAYSDFQQACVQDERLKLVSQDTSLGGLLSTSLARVNRTMAGLRQLSQQVDPDTRASITRDGILRFAGEQFEGYRQWTQSADVAALIKQLEIHHPFPAELAGNLELVDCQGSDSLNPLDFADIESIVQRADQLLYVVQSRLGVRQADRELLLHMGQSGAAQRLIAVLNVEVFAPLTADELGTLVKQTQDAISSSVGQEVQVLPVVALHALERLSEDSDEARLMQRLWERQGLSDVWHALQNNFNRLRGRLQDLAGRSRAQTDDPASDPVAIGAREQAGKIASALLERDSDILGVQSSQVTRNEARVAVQRIIEGEATKLNKDAAHLCMETFQTNSPLQAEIDGFLELGDAESVSLGALPEAVNETQAPGVIIDAALEQFNHAWLTEHAQARTLALRNLQNGYAQQLLEGASRILSLLANAVPEGVLDASNDSVGAESAALLLDDARDKWLPPEVAKPVVLSVTGRQGLVARFHSAKLLGKLAKSKTQAQTQRELLGKFWQQCLKAAFRQAREDRKHSIINARENFKYQYFYKLTAQVLDALQAQLLDDVEQFYAGLERLEEANRLLLDGSERVAVERYLARLGTRRR